MPVPCICAHACAVRVCPVPSAGGGGDLGAHNGLVVAMLAERAAKNRADADKWVHGACVPSPLPPMRMLRAHTSIAPARARMPYRAL
jgi:hypothetical protein